MHKTITEIYHRAAQGEWYLTEMVRTGGIGTDAALARCRLVESPESIERLERLYSLTGLGQLLGNIRTGQADCPVECLVELLRGSPAQVRQELRAALYLASCGGRP